jgi:hypothetical protein
MTPAVTSGPKTYTQTMAIVASSRVSRLALFAVSVVVAMHFLRRLNAGACALGLKTAGDCRAFWAARLAPESGDNTEE